MPSTDPVAARVEALDWVEGVFETERPQATHRVETVVSNVRMDHEGHDLENVGATLESVCTCHGPTARVYVRI